MDGFEALEQSLTVQARHAQAGGPRRDERHLEDATLTLGGESEAELVRTVGRGLEGREFGLGETAVLGATQEPLPGAGKLLARVPEEDSGPLGPHRESARRDRRRLRGKEIDDDPALLPPACPEGGEPGHADHERRASVRTVRCDKADERRREGIGELAGGERIRLGEHEVVRSALAQGSRYQRASVAQDDVYAG